MKKLILVVCGAGLFFWGGNAFAADKVCEDTTCVERSDGGILAGSWKE